MPGRVAFRGTGIPIIRITKHKQSREIRPKKRSFLSQPRFSAYSLPLKDSALSAGIAYRLV
jgi:hypothetical protein